MKKLLIMFAVLGILTACQKEPAMQQNPQETPAAQPAEQAQEPAKVDEKWLTFETFDAQTNPDNTPMPPVLVPEQEQPCTINGYDCREVIAKLSITKEEPASEEVANGETPYWNVPGGTKYVNPALDEMGMKITQYLMTRDGSQLYVLDDNVGINIKSTVLDIPEKDKVFVKFKDGDTFTFRPAEPIQPQTPAAQQTEQPAPVAEEIQVSECSIKGHDCWEIVEKLSATQEVRTPKENPTEEESLWAPDVITYSNPDLESLGMKVTFYTMYRDGGSTRYVIDDEVSIHTNNSLAADISQRGTKTIKFKDGPTFVYSPDGQLQK